MTAALQIDRTEARARPALRDGPQRAPLRCVLMDDNSFDRRMLRRVVEGSRYRIDVVETAGIAETRRELEGRPADLLLLDYHVPDGDGIAFARELSTDARHAATPVVVVTGVGSEQAAVQAIRSGVADYLSKDGLTTEEFDQAVENALRRSSVGAADQVERIAELTAENQALRRATLGNMRLLKGNVLPLLSFSWRMPRGDRATAGARAGETQELGRLTRVVLALIDETVILAATHRAADKIGPVDLGEVVAAIVRDEAGEIRQARATIRVGALPVLKAHASQMLLLFEELLLSAVRAARLGHAPEVEFGSASDRDGNPIVWLREHGLRLPARRHATAERFGTLAGASTGPAAASGGRDAYSWSLCQRIVERHDGQFRIAANEGEGCTIRMRFPKAMLACPPGSSDVRSGATHANERQE